MLNSNLSDNILYFGLLKIRKTENGHQNVKKPHIFYGLSHMKFKVSARFLFDNDFLVSSNKNHLYLTQRIRRSMI